MLRVSTQMIYSQSINYVNGTLAKLTELNEQASSMKRVNKPSDDPTGTATILNLNTTLGAYDQYADNIDTAQSWLATSDSTLTQVSTLITRLKELAEEGATGTLSGDNRSQISYEARQIYQQLIALANTEYQGQSIYAGQNTGENAFTECLWMTSDNVGLSTSNSFAITGDSDTTVLVQFLNSNAASGASCLMSTCDVRFSTDGGTTWKNGSVTKDAGNHIAIDLPGSGVSMSFDRDTLVENNSLSDPADTCGTWMWLRPSAIYNGDDADKENTIVQSSGQGSELLKASAAGSFSCNTIVRIDNASPANLGGEIDYSYSLDNGITWITGNKVNADPSTPNSATLEIASGGLLELSNNGSSTINPGTVFVITPATADVSLQISSSESVRVNDVGKDIFGGIYQDPQAARVNGGNRLAVTSSNAAAAFSSTSSIYTSNGGMTTKNLFETVGNLVAFLETNNQTGVSQCLESLKLCQTQITTAMASVGGRENRLSTAETIIGNLQDSLTKQLSSIEDVDLTKLLTRLSQQETAYEAVLKSSSMVMNMSLMNYL
jgi:flagellar hook-associated protein 3 FlgL